MRPLALYFASTALIILACAKGKDEDEPVDLTDLPDPPGVCDVCPGASSCAPSTELCVTELGFVDFKPNEFATGGGTAFVAANNAPSIWALPLDGGAAVEVGNVESGGIQGLAANADRVFWMSMGGDLHSADHDGGNESLLANMADDCGSIAADDAFVYCARRNYDNENSTNGLARIPVGGGDIEMLYEGDTPDAVVLADDRAYLSLHNKGKIGWVPVVGGDYESLDNDIQSSDLILGIDSLFAADDEAIYQIPLDGSGAVAVLDDDTPLGEGGNGLYYWDSGSKTISLAAAPFTSGVAVLKTQLGDISTAQGDGAHLYFAVDANNGYTLYDHVMQ